MITYYNVPHICEEVSLASEPLGQLDDGVWVRPCEFDVFCV